MPPTIDDPAILDEIKQDLIDNKILNNIKTIIFCEVAGKVPV